METKEQESATEVSGPDEDYQLEEPGPGLTTTLDDFVRLHRGKIVTGIVILVAIALVGRTQISLGRVVVEAILNGSVIALVALGVAVVYKSTGVLNFAQGELGTTPAFIVLVVMLAVQGGGAEAGPLLERSLDVTQITPVAMVGYTLLAVVVGSLFAVGMNLLVIQRLVDASPVITLVATAAVSFLLIGAQFVIFELRVRTFPRFIADAPCLERAADGECVNQLSLFGQVILWHAIVVVIILAIVAVLLGLLFKTPIGVALLASSQEPFAASLYGVSPRAMSTFAWGVAGGLGGLAGVLGAGVFQQLFPAMVTRDLLVLAFTAAVLGGITSMPGAVVGGLILGATAALANSAVLAYNMTHVIPSPPTVTAFAVLLVIMYVRPRGLLGKEA
jgi:branched-chain amino acid transport system permease protein